MAPPGPLPTPPAPRSPCPAFAPPRQGDTRRAGGLIGGVIAEATAERRQGKGRGNRSRVVYRGPVFHVTASEVVEPMGVQVHRDVVRHSGSVVIIAVDETRREPRVLLARQYRFAVNARLWELPAGRIDEGERELPAAKRELLEETGYSARRWQLAFRFYSSPGFLDERMALYLARDLQRGAAQPEEDEDIALRFFPLSAAVRMAANGRIYDAKTIAGVLWLKNLLRS